jgi:hypothetical protein
MAQTTYNTAATAGLRHNQYFSIEQALQFCYNNVALGINRFKKIQSWGDVNDNGWFFNVSKQGLFNRGSFGDGGALGSKGASDSVVASGSFFESDIPIRATSRQLRTIKQSNSFVKGSLFDQAIQEATLGFIKTDNFLLYRNGTGQIATASGATGTTINTAKATAVEGAYHLHEGQEIDVYDPTGTDKRGTAVVDTIALDYTSFTTQTQIPGVGANDKIYFRGKATGFYSGFDVHINNTGTHQNIAVSNNRFWTSTTLNANSASPLTADLINRLFSYVEARGVEESVRKEIELWIHAGQRNAYMTRGYGAKRFTGMDYEEGFDPNKSTIMGRKFNCDDDCKFTTAFAIWPKAYRWIINKPLGREDSFGERGMIRDYESTLGQWLASGICWLTDSKELVIASRRHNAKITNLSTANVGQAFFDWNPGAGVI